METALRIVVMMVVGMVLFFSQNAWPGVEPTVAVDHPLIVRGDLGHTLVPGQPFELVGSHSWGQARRGKQGAVHGQSVDPVSGHCGRRSHSPDDAPCLLPVGCGSSVLVAGGVGSADGRDGSGRDRRALSWP